MNASDLEFSQKSPIISQKSPISRKTALYSRKTALHSRKTALHSLKRALYSHKRPSSRDESDSKICILKVCACVCVHARSPSLIHTRGFQIAVSSYFMILFEACSLCTWVFFFTILREKNSSLLQKEALSIRRKRIVGTYLVHTLNV